jgi:vacuolar protein sorting-associated protein 54
VRPRFQPYLSAPASSLHQTPTSRDIPPVALTNIKSVDAAEFEQCISQVGPLYGRLKRTKDSEDEAGPRRRSKSDEPFADYGLTRRGSSASTTSSTAPNKGRYGLHPLSSIPDIYFDKEFHLQNPKIFDVVSERPDVVPQEKPFLPMQSFRRNSHGIWIQLRCTGSIPSL